MAEACCCVQIVPVSSNVSWASTNIIALYCTQYKALFGSVDLKMAMANKGAPRLPLLSHALQDLSSKCDQVEKSFNAIDVPRLLSLKLPPDSLLKPYGVLQTHVRQQMLHQSVPISVRLLSQCSCVMSYGFQTKFLCWRWQILLCCRQHVDAPPSALAQSATGCYSFMRTCSCDGQALTNALLCCRHGHGAFHEHGKREHWRPQNAVSLLQFVGSPLPLRSGDS